MASAVEPWTWAEIYHRVREQDYRTAALLNSGCGLTVTATEAIFGFRHRSHLARIGDREMDLLWAVVREVVGERMISCVLDPDAKVESSVRGGYMVKAAVQLGANVPDVVDVIGATTPLERVGTARFFLGRCPFCGGALRVGPETQQWLCTSCWKHGDWWQWASQQ